MLALVSALSFGVGCNNAQCENLRDELTKKKREWSRCESDLDCIKVLGNPGDCTGVMSCDFSVNRRSRLDAERRIASLPEDTVDCMECQSPNCVSGKITLCDIVTHQCLLVTEILDGGSSEGSGGTSAASGEQGQ